MALQSPDTAPRGPRSFSLSRGASSAGGAELSAAFHGLCNSGRSCVWARQAERERGRCLWRGHAALCYNPESLGAMIFPALRRPIEKGHSENALLPEGASCFGAGPQKIGASASGNRYHTGTAVVTLVASALVMIRPMPWLGIGRKYDPSKCEWLPIGLRRALASQVDTGF